jgi:hypothetical protein
VAEVPVGKGSRYAMKKSGQDVCITKELVDEVLAGIDDSYDRVKRFMASEWAAEETR